MDPRRILLAISGGIAAYKAVDLASRLTKLGCIVKTIMTETLFLFLNIWCLFFYLNSHKKSAVLFAILAAFTRPFGFITILACLYVRFRVYVIILQFQAGKFKFTTTIRVVTPKKK